MFTLGTGEREEVGGGVWLCKKKKTKKKKKNPPSRLDECCDESPFAGTHKTDLP